MRMSRRWFGCAAVMCLTVAQLSGCSSKPLVSGFHMPGMKSRAATSDKGSKKHSAEESDDLLAQAREFEKQGDFPNAARLYREYLNSGGQPLRPDSPALAEADRAKTPKAPAPDSLASKSTPRGGTEARTASRPTALPQTRTAAKTETQSAPKSTAKSPDRALAKKTTAPLEEDPWANRPAPQAELPVIRPGKKDLSETAATPKPQAQKAVAQNNDAGIPDWAKGQTAPGTSQSTGKSRKTISQAEIDELLDLEADQIDWGDEPAEETQQATREPHADDLTEESALLARSVKDDAGDSEAANDLQAPALEEAATSEVVASESADDSWDTHSEEALEQSVAEGDELSAPILTEDEETPPAEESIALLCKDCEPWVYSQAVKLESSDPEVRKEALTKLADMGSTARQAGLAVRSLLEDSDPLVQAHAAWALWEIENEPLESVSTLTDLLDHTNNEVVQLACYMLGDIGPQADSGRHPLELLRDNADSTTRIHAAEALIRIEGGGAASAKILVESAKSQDIEERWIAVVALGRCRGEQAPLAVKALTSALNDVSPDVRSAAALSLGGLGAAAASARPQLEKMAQNDDPAVRDAAIAALACLKTE